MIELSRVCIPLGLDCNFKCRYCYRDFCRKQIPTKLSNCVKEYLKQLTPDKAESVCMSGGEPLIYWNTIKEIYSYLPKDIHLKIMTNGSLLTQEIIDFVNQNNAEIFFSHDGIQTKYLRGIDVLEDKNKLQLIKQVKNLVVSSVITNRNEDLVKNYQYISEKLQREDFVYRFTNLMDTGYVDDLIKGFNYDVFARSYREYTENYKTEVPYYNRIERNKKYNMGGFNVDLDGNVIGMNTLKKYGTIYNTYEECYQKMLEVENLYCTKVNCPLIFNCQTVKQGVSEHTCKCVKAMNGVL